LRAQAEGLLSPDEQQQTVTGIADPTSAQETSDVADALSLLKWISAKDNQSSLEQVADQCSRGLEQFDERVMEALKNEVIFSFFFVITTRQSSGELCENILFVFIALTCRLSQFNTFFR
jgi:hypothetical protein